MKNEHKMNESESNHPELRVLIETSWRRPLTENELARLEHWFTRHPEDRAEWEAEATLNRCLASLPDAPVPSNFTALVLQAVRREHAAPRPEPSLIERIASLFRRPSVRLGWALLLVCAAALGYQHYQAGVRHDLATGLTALAHVAALPGPAIPAILKDFDTIQRLGPATESEDDDLYSVLSQ